jgi:hypothetical protein
MADILDRGMNALSGGIDVISNTIQENQGLAIGVASGIAVAGTALGTVAVVKAIKKRKKAKKRKSQSRVKHKRKSKRNKHRSTRRRSGRHTPRTAGKGKDTSHRRIRYTKKGQPYVILTSGKARFIKKKSAKSSHKRKGGRY